MPQRGGDPLSGKTRAYLALGLGWAITAFFAGLVLLFAVPYIVMFRWWLSRVWSNPLQFAPYAWAVVMEEVCCKLLLGTKIETFGRIETTNGLIVFGNHPSTMAMPTFFRAVLRDAKRFRIVLKREHLRNPVVGWTVWLMEAGIFIDREDGSAVAAIKRALRHERDLDGCVFIIFPDGTRPTKKKITEIRIKLASEHNAWTSAFRHTTVPKSGGLYAIIQAFPQLAVFDATIGTEYADEGVEDVEHLAGTTTRLRFENVTDAVPHDRTAFDAWIMQSWRKKNRLIEEWRARPRRLTNGRASTG